MDSTGTTVAELYDTALADHQAGDIDSAIAGYQQVIELDGTNKVAFNNLGTALKSKKKVEDAIRAYRRAIELDPSYAAAIYNLGTALHVTGDYVSALVQYLVAARLCPNDANTLFNIGLIAEYMHYYTLAVDAYGMSAQLSPENSSAKAGLARCLTFTGDSEQALRLFENLVSAHPERASFWAQYGDAFERIGAHSKAAACIRKASALSPETIEIKMELSRTLYRSADFEATVDLCREVVQQDKGFGPGYQMMAAALRKLGRVAEAEEQEAIAEGLPLGAPGWVFSILAIPPLPFDRNQIQQVRDSFFEAAQEAEEIGGKMADPSLSVKTTAFYYAYHGRNDREIMERLAQMFLKMTPDLAWTSPHTQRQDLRCQC